MTVVKENIRELSKEEIGSVAGGSTPLCITFVASVAAYFILVR